MPDTRPVTDKDLLVTRSFAAPVATLWKFWTEPALLSQWYGPEGCSAPLDKIEIDPRVGGVWSVTIHNDETGDEFPIVGRITAFDVNEYLEILPEGDTFSGDLDDFGLLVTFHDDGDSCRVTLHQGEFTAEDMVEAKRQWEISWKIIDGLIQEPLPLMNR